MDAHRCDRLLRNDGLYLVKGMEYEGKSLILQIHIASDGHAQEDLPQHCLFLEPHMEDVDRVRAQVKKLKIRYKCSLCG